MDNFRYTNEKCPVCGEQFTFNDDIVVCPLCGAPHHRDCYRKNGECSYSDKHNEGFVWKPENEPAPESAPTEAQPFGANQAYQPYANPANAQMPPYTFQGAPYGAPVQFQNPLNAFPQEIDEGVSTEDAAAYIRRNPYVYLRKFFARSNGKLTFNFAAFFFGGYWFIYRKMNKLGAIFIALTLALSAIPMLVPQYTRLQSELGDITSDYEDFDGATAEDPLNSVNEMYSKMFSAVRKNPVGAAVGIFSYIAEIGLSLYMGFIADKKYKEHVVNSIREINSSQSSVGNEEYRKMKIWNEGGTSFGAAILVAIVVTVINNLLSLLTFYLFIK